MSEIRRIGVTRRWSDAVVHGGTAYFVEVADDPGQDMHGQVSQILNQIDRRLALVGSDRTRLLQVLIYVSDLASGPTLNSLWDEWVPEGHAPARACVQVGISPGYLVEMVVTAAVD
jgi:enamine deaminase RidA (YjgF/YER057c/UK114 family)